MNKELILVISPFVFVPLYHIIEWIIDYRQKKNDKRGKRKDDLRSVVCSVKAKCEEKQFKIETGEEESVSDKKTVYGSSRC